MGQTIVPQAGINNGIVTAIAEDDNNFYIGGTFTSVGGSRPGRIAKISTTNDQVTVNQPLADRNVNVVVPDGSGGWFIGGSIRLIDGLQRLGIAHILSDGTLDLEWNPIISAPATVNSIAVSGSDVYVGGSFSTVGGQTRNRLVKLNKTTGEVDPDWNPNANSIVNTIAVLGSDIYVGGFFTTVGGLTRNRIVKLNNTTGEVDASWNPNPNNLVQKITISGDDIYVSGDFSSIGGQTRNGLAKLNKTTGLADVTWDPGIKPVMDIAISGDAIYVGGNFTSVGGETRNRLAKINNTTGEADPSWNPDSNGIINSIAISGSDVYVGGNFTTVGGQSRNRLAKLNNTTGTADPNWDPKANNTVNSIAISGSDVFFGGAFTILNDIARNRVARISKITNEIDPDWNPNANNFVSTIVVSGSDIYLGGTFTNVGGQSLNRLAKVNNTTGDADADWNPNANGEVSTIKIADSDIYLGGAFTTIGGQTRNRIAKINKTTGALDPDWNPIANGTVRTIAISGSDIYLGGAFTTTGGQIRNRIAKINKATGALDPDWNPNAGSTAGNEVFSIAVSGDDIYVGGIFNSLGGLPRSRIAKLNNTTGAADPVWNANGANGVNSIAISGSNIYVGGSFTTIGGASRLNLAKLNNTDGAVDPMWIADAGNISPTASSVSVNIVVVSANYLYVGGSFSSIQGKSIARFVVLKNTNDPPAAPSAPIDLAVIQKNGEVEMTFTAGPDGGSAITNYEYSLDEGDTWVTLDPVQTTSPLTITGIDNTVSYTIQLRAVNAAGAGTASSSVAVPALFAGGTGTESDPYQIENWEQLQNIGVTISSWLYYELTTNLNESSFGYEQYASENANSGLGWVLEGDFIGRFDGNFHTISGLHINRPTEDNIGLFRTTYGSARIINLGLLDVSIVGKDFVGGVTGLKYAGEFSKVFVTGSVSGVNQVGGIAGRGYSGGSINDSYTEVTVTSTGNNVGGFVGLNHDGSSIYRSYSAGTVTGTGTNIGGFTGFMENGGRAENSFWNTDTSGLSTSAGGIGKTSAEMKTLFTFTDWDFETTWKINPSGYLSYPYLQGISYDEPEADPSVNPIPGLEEVLYAGGSGTESDPYKISDWGHLHNVRKNLTAFFILNNDLDENSTGYSKYASSTANDNAGWLPIKMGSSYFSGEFDGNLNEIKGLYINRPSERVGLFEQIRDGGRVKNIYLVEFNFIGSNGGSLAGGLAEVSISNVHVRNTSISATSNVGGLSGSMSGGSIISGSSSSGSISGTGVQVGGLVGTIGNSQVIYSFSSALISGGTRVGGLVGSSSYGTISNSYSIGDVTVTTDLGGGLIGYVLGGTVANSYGAGAVSGAGTNQGGLVGQALDNPTFTNSFWDTETSGKATSAAGTAKTTEEMKTQSTFTGWDFTAGTGNWSINPTGYFSYPYLQAITYDEPGSEPEVNPIPGLDTPPFAGGKGTELEPYQIEDWEHLYNIRNFETNYFILNNDLNAASSGYETYAAQAANSGAGWLPPFSLNNIYLDGKGFTIGDLFINRKVTGGYNTGLFGGLNNSSIKNLVLEDFQVVGANTTGALVGYAESVVFDNVHVINANISSIEYNTGLLIGRGVFSNVLNSSAEGILSGEYRLGGIFGGLDFGKIENSFAKVTITGTQAIGGLVGMYYVNPSQIAIKQSFASGTISGSGNLGGLIGQSYNSKVHDSYSQVDVKGTGNNIGGLIGSGENTEFLNSYATGKVQGAGSVGGISGGGSIISNSFWDKETTGQEGNADGGTGLLTAELKDKNLYLNASWDFETVWEIKVSAEDEGYISYPYLQAFTYDEIGASPEVNPIPGLVPVSLPELTTATSINVTTVSATLGGEVTSDGGVAVTERGIVWSVNTNPTITDTKIEMGSGIGTFSETVIGLPTGSTIYVRAYATNSMGTAYGEEVVFDTQSPSPPTLTSTPITTIPYGQFYNYTIEGSEESELETTISAPTLPSWLSFNTSESGPASLAGTVPNGVRLRGAAADNDGNIYTIRTDGTQIFKITPDGTSTSWRSGIFGNVFSLHIANGYLYISRNNNFSNAITRVPLNNPSAEEEVFLSRSGGVISLIDKDGFIYAANYPSSEILKINETTKEVSVVLSDLFSNSPFGLTIDNDNNLFFAAFEMNSILKYDGIELITVLSDLPKGPTSIKTDDSGNFYISMDNGGIRKYSSDFSSFEVVSMGASDNIWSLSLSSSGLLVYAKVNTNEVYRLQTRDVLTGTPAKSDLGDHPVTLRATNDAGFTEQSFTITVTDESAPFITTLSPANNATNVALQPTLILTFDEEVDLGNTGVFKLSKVGEDHCTLVSIFEFDLIDPEVRALFVLSEDRLSVSLSITENLSLNTQILVEIPQGFVVDGSDNSIEGFSAASYTWTFTTRNKNEQTITFDEIGEKTYGDLTFTLGNAVTDRGLTVTYTAEDPTVVSISGNQATILKTGTTKITATQAGDEENFAAESVEQNLTVNQKALTVTADENQSKVYGSVDPSLTYRLTSGELIGEDEFTGTLTRAEGEDVGNFEIIQGSLTAGDNYTIAFTGADFSITPAEITAITFEDGSFVYDGTAKSLEIEGKLPQGTNLAYSNNSRTDVGSQTVIATITGDNYSTLELTATLAITPATVTGIEFNGESFVFDFSTKSLVIEGTLPQGTSVSYSNNSRTDVGSQEVTATITGDNFTTLELTATLAITPATIEGITFENGSFVYDGNAKSLEIEGILPDGTSVAYSNNSRTDVGSQTATATITGDNFTTLVLTATLAITPATIEGITFENGSFVYNGNSKSLAIAGALPDGTSAAYSNNSRTDVGSQTATATITGDNFTTLVLTATLAITPAPIEGITFENGSFVFDGSAKSLAIAGELPEGTSVSYSNNSLTNVGSQTATATITGDNFTTLVMTATLAITPATIEGITLENGSFVFDGSAKSLMITGTLPEGTSVSYADNSRTDVGSQTATATITGDNYSTLVLTATLAITPAPIEGITFENGSFVFDGSAKSLEIAGELPDGTSVAYSNNSLTNVGSQTATATITGDNYSTLVVTATLAITPATVEGVTFENGSFVYDGNAKSLEIAGELPEGTLVAYSNNSRTDVGSQTATATITGDNFTTLVLTATLAITPATIEGITFGNGSFVFDGSAKSLEIEGILPEGTSVEYSNNSLTNVGSQTATATITGDNFTTLVLTATLAITPATVEGITFENGSFVFDGSAKSLAIAGELPEGTSVAYSNNSRTDVGSQTATATITGDNFTTLVLTATLAITPAPIEGITFENGSFVFDGSAKSLEIGGILHEGTAVAYSNNSLINVGSQTATATITGDNYSTLVLTATLAITPATVEGITFGNGSFVFDGSAKSLEIEGILPEGTSVAYGNNSLINVGSQTATATITGDNYSTLVLSATLAITPAPIEGITFENGSFVFDGTAKSLVISGELPEGTSVAYSNNSLTNVGSQTATATISGANYSTLELTATLAITPATVTGIEFNGESFVFDGSTKSLVIEGTLPQGTSVSYSNNSRTDVGSQEVTATITGDNFTTLELTATLAITPATIEGITFENGSFVFDGTAKSLEIEGILPQGTSVEYGNNSRTDAGSQTATATITGDNFTTLELTATLAITPATIEGITFENGSFVFDGSAKSLEIEGILPQGTSVEYGNNSRTDAGSQTATATITGDNFTTLELTATLAITPATIEGITFENGSFVFDGSVKSLEIEGILPEGTSVSYADNSRTDVGSQTATATISGDNYSTLELTATLAITPATVEGITFENGSFVFDGSAKSLEIAGELPEGTSVAYSNNSRTDVGSQTATATITGDNFTTLVLTATLAITPATIEGITFENGSFVYDGNAKSLAIAGELPEGTSVAYSN
ncbi:MBG domain-containing protein, partial [Rhodonellum ikkaensis]|uniref:MBG domain-containing protein n=3 Tax=Rhodonellum TaxID=336827 RepID=UPI0015877909